MDLNTYITANLECEWQYVPWWQINDDYTIRFLLAIDLSEKGFQRISLANYHRSPTIAPRSEAFDKFQSMIKGHADLTRDTWGELPVVYWDTRFSPGHQFKVGSLVS